MQHIYGLSKIKNSRSKKKTLYKKMSYIKTMICLINIFISMTTKRKNYQYKHHMRKKHDHKNFINNIIINCLVMMTTNYWEIRRSKWREKLLMTNEIRNFNEKFIRINYIIKEKLAKSAKGVQKLRVFQINWRNITMTFQKHSQNYILKTKYYDFVKERRRRCITFLYLLCKLCGVL